VTSKVCKLLEWDSAEGQADDVPAGGVQADDARAGALDGFDPEAGVTLLEALVWLALLSMLAVMIANGASLTARSWRNAEHQTNAVDDMETTRSLLRRVFRSARPALMSPDPSDSRIAFEGHPDRVTFVAPRSGQAVAGEWILQALYVAPLDGESALFLAWGEGVALSRGSRGRDEANPNRAPLLERVGDISLSYFGPPEGGGQPVWQATWLGRKQLPEMIRMGLKRNGDAVPWPELVVAPRVNANAACRFFPGRTGCERGP